MLPIILTTPCGQIKGIQESGYNKFLGIPYATAKRFEAPKETKALKGIYQAISYGNACIQGRTFTAETDENFYYREFRKGLNFSYSEDCQFLNIWTPKEGEKLPVILYIHGGAFQGGCGNEKPFDGQYFAQKGVIFVTCNYRLGPLGFAVTEDNGKLIGNFGLQDQMVALRWLTHNIASFGGDPDNITLMGQSAGAMSIQQLICSPEVKTTIAKAIMTSGGGLGIDFAKAQPIAEVRQFWKKVENSFLQEGKDFRTVAYQELFERVQSLLLDVPNGIDYLSPTVDGDIIPYNAEELQNRFIEADIPYLMGTTKDDMLSDVLYDMTSQWINRRNKKHPHSAYQFYFARNLPGDEAGAWHSSDLWYTIGAMDESWRPMTDWDKKISEVLMSYIVNFVHTDNPNKEGLPDWIPSTKEDDILCVTDLDIKMGRIN